MSREVAKKAVQWQRGRIVARCGNAWRKAGSPNTSVRRLRPRNDRVLASARHVAAQVWHRSYAMRTLMRVNLFTSDAHGDAKPLRPVQLFGVLRVSSCSTTHMKVRSPVHAAPAFQRHATYVAVWQENAVPANANALLP